MATKQDMQRWPRRLAVSVLGFFGLACGCAAQAVDEGPAATQPHALGATSPWQQAQSVTAPTPAAFDQYGLSPALCGDLAVVGAWHADTAGAGGSTRIDTGAAYVYERDRVGRRFTLVAQLTASDGKAGDAFGFAVACNGDTIAVGALFADGAGPSGTTLADSGAVYLFEKRSDGWTQTQKLTAVDAAGSDAFGFALAMSADALLIGAPYVDATPLLDVGAAYIYRRLSSGWVVDSKLLVRDGAASDFFGRAVALSGETALIGAMHRDVSTASGVATDAGSAYVFGRRAGRFIQEQQLVASDAKSRDLYGFAVALASDVGGDVAVVGAYLADLPDSGAGLPRSNAGAAYVYRRSGGVFAAGEKLVAPDAARDDYFGTSLAIAQNRLLVGALYADIDLPDGSRKSNGGAVYAFSDSGAAFRFHSKLTAADVADRDVLGRQVAMSGNTALLAAPGKAIAGLPEAGAAYFFDYTPLALGAACQPETGGLDCLSGFCSDGVCCDSACGGDSEYDCQGCRAALTGQLDGQCAPTLRNVVCRAKNPGNSCDIDDVCDGKSRLCPSRSVAAGTPCRSREFCGECGPRGTCEATRLCR